MIASPRIVSSFALCLSASVIGAGSVAAGDRDNLAGDDLRRAVSGRTVRLETPMGGLPITFRSDGTMSGVAGTLASYTGSDTDEGRWWVKGDHLCQKWNAWLKQREYCFTLRRDGRDVQWTRNDGLSGSATITR